jgi:choline dehydrogenase-like flavoprotein
VNSVYDVVVVGSGPVGSAFARTLVDADPAVSVLMVEVGPLIAEPAGRHVRNLVEGGPRAAAQTASQGPRRTDVLVIPAEGDGAPSSNVVRPGTFLISDGMTTSTSRGMPAATMSSNVGGMGAHWTAACPKPGGRERIAEIPPLEMQAALDAADALLGVTQEAFADSQLARQIVDELGAAVPRDPARDRPVQPMPLAARRRADGSLEWAGTDAILRPVLESGAVQLRTETLATSILIEDGRAVGVRLRDLRTGSDDEVRARTVFVAADAFRTPQLLFASGVRPWALGRYVNDHADVRTFVQLDDRFKQTDGRGGVTWIPYSDDGFPYHCQAMQLDASPIGFVPSGEEWPGSTVGVVLFGTKELSDTDRVSFSDDEVDAYGMPALEVEYHLTARDLETERAMLGMSRRIADVLGTALIEPRVLPAGGSYHIMGSVRLGDHPATSVCDPTGAVWGVDSLFVGGNGVIPTPTACNPTITSVALSIRSAQAIAARRAG